VRAVCAGEIAPGVVSISWDPHRFRNVQDVEYEVLLENEREEQALTICQETNLVITEVEPNHCYSVQVCAVNSRGRGPFCMAPMPVDIREACTTTLPYELPLDGCASSWFGESRAPLGGEHRYTGLLGLVVCAVTLVGTAALDVELAIAQYSALSSGDADGPLLACVLIGGYLLFGAAATIVVDSAEDALSPALTAYLAKLIAATAVALFHLHLHAELLTLGGAIASNGSVVGDRLRLPLAGFERKAIEFAVSIDAALPKAPSRRVFFNVMVRCVAGFGAGGVKQLAANHTSNTTRELPNTRSATQTINELSDK